MLAAPRTFSVIGWSAGGQRRRGGAERAGEDERDEESLHGVCSVSGLRVDWPDALHPHDRDLCVLLAGTCSSRNDLVTHLTHRVAR